MAEFNAEILAQQLGELGRELEKEVKELARVEEVSVDAEAIYRDALEEYEESFARALIRADGSVEMKKAVARVECRDSRIAREDYYKVWQLMKAKVRTQQALVQAIHRRIEIGRSLLSREKALMSL